MQHSGYLGGCIHLFGNAHPQIYHLSIAAALWLLMLIVCCMLCLQKAIVSTWNLYNLYLALSDIGKTMYHLRAFSTQRLRQSCEKF